MRFPFDEDRRLGVITTVHVLAGDAVLMVTHDADDGGWQFLCGKTNEPSDGRIVALEEILQMDPTLAELADLPLGWIAFRAQVGVAWTRERD